MFSNCAFDSILMKWGSAGYVRVLGFIFVKVSELLHLKGPSQFEGVPSKEFMGFG